MVSLYFLLFYINILLIGCVLVYIYKLRKLIGFQLGMTISMVAGGFFAFTSGIIFIYVYPFHFLPVTIAATLLGMAVGSIFGSFFDYQTLLSGYSNGLMMGMMSPMVGAVAKNSFLFLSFAECLFFASLLLVLSSARQT
ncbi:hypothetical protein ELQ35_10360 [Peribacillus cavernae]|uniref:Uncharacterized protein n=1 Tax=Peribacillus cavernae TaxID=1674310 RepID=A0A3S0U1V3_9BACI|nr:hypothetical protein [Peribacillus cavernae]MDQ0218930.1 putative membrane protein [Peribacillus cavernae]RUQ29357.1 hypothetical protein ELQ35_10360 [Peribacillus cavernae]